jgi:hypothetical protein
VHLDRCAFVATPRTTVWPLILFLVVDARRRAFRQHPRTYRAGRRCLDLSRPELRRDGMEGYRTTSPDYLDGLPSWWASALVRLLGVQKRSLLRTPGGSALWRRAVVCLPRLLWLGLFKPAAISSRSKPEPRSKDPDEARRQPELGGAVPAQTKGNAHAHISAFEGARADFGGDFLGPHQIVAGPAKVLIAMSMVKMLTTASSAGSRISRPLRAGAREVVTRSPRDPPHDARVDRGHDDLGAAGARALPARYSRCSR